MTLPPLSGISSTLGLHERCLGPWHDLSVIEQLRAAAEALNRGDPEPFVSLIAAENEWRGVPYGHLWWKRTPA
jgi:hypothetical protein